MKVIITKKLKKELEKFYRYFTLQEFVDDLKEQSEVFLHIHDDFFKFRSNLNSIKFRGIVVLMKEKDNIIPLFIALKKDKLYGENIIWENYKKFIKKRFFLILKEIGNGDFEEFI